jgi:DNA-binding MarR family transcriptional regulator
MEENGLITRTRFETDQRRVTVGLTAKGQGVVDELSPLIRAQYQVIEQSFGPELIRELYALMDRVLEVDDLAIPKLPLPKRKRSPSKPVKALQRNA